MERAPVAREAVELMLEHYVEHGEPLPVEKADSVIDTYEGELTGFIMLIRVAVTVEERDGAV